jgi:hypothetical protein
MSIALQVEQRQWRNLLISRVRKTRCPFIRREAVDSVLRNLGPLVKERFALSLRSRRPLYKCL